MDYTGDIIQESLTDPTILGQTTITRTRVERVTEAHQTPWLKQWTLHTIIVNKDKADELAHQLSDSLESSHGWYIDYRNSEYHYVIFAGKVFKLDRTKKQDYEAMVKYGLSVGGARLPVAQLF